MRTIEVVKNVLQNHAIIQTVLMILFENILKRFFIGSFTDTLDHPLNGW
jgi:hypothetical protein